MQTYLHKPLEVQAIQVARPWRNVTAAFPRSHKVQKASGAVAYFRLLDADHANCRAYPGDWIVRYWDGTVAIYGEEEFHARFDQA